MNKHNSLQEKKCIIQGTKGAFENFQSVSLDLRKYCLCKTNKKGEMKKEGEDEDEIITN